MDELKLSDREKKIYEMLSYNADTMIVDIYGALKPNYPAPTLREQQQFLGVHITRLNKKLTGGSVRPGIARGSYRLYLANS